MGLAIVLCAIPAPRTCLLYWVRGFGSYRWSRFVEVGCGGPPTLSSAGRGLEARGRTCGHNRAKWAMAREPCGFQSADPLWLLTGCNAPARPGCWAWGPDSWCWSSAPKRTGPPPVGELLRQHRPALPGTVNNVGGKHHCGPAQLSGKPMLSSCIGPSFQRARATFRSHAAGGRTSPRLRTARSLTCSSGNQLGRLNRQTRGTAPGANKIAQISRRGCTASHQPGLAPAP